MTWQPTCANTADIIHLARRDYSVNTCNTLPFSVRSGLERYTSNDHLHGFEAYCRFQLTEKGCPGPGTTAIRTPALIEPLSRGNGRPMSGVRPWTSRAISTVGFEYDHHICAHKIHKCLILRKIPIRRELFLVIARYGMRRELAVASSDPGNPWMFKSIS